MTQSNLIYRVIGKKMFDKNLFTKIPFLAATVESVEKNQFKFKEIYDLPMPGTFLYHLGIGKIFGYTEFSIQITNFFFMPLIFLGGVFWSIEMLPKFWQHFSMANPTFE